MPRDKTDSHEKVLASAIEEFRTYGFENASMRRIGQRIGMTAAGLYRHCKDKADLFEQIVGPAAQAMQNWLTDHATHSMAVVQQGGDQESLWDQSANHMMSSLIYPHMDEYHILFAHSQGTKYEHLLHDLTEQQQIQMMEAINLLREQGRPVFSITEKALHLLLTAYNSALFEPVIHHYSLEEALTCLKTVEAFFMPGWKRLMGF